MNDTRKKALEEFVILLGLPAFQHLQYLDIALTHSSYANENKEKRVRFNERLEFLGDAILDLVIGEYLFLHYPEMTEGELSKARASVVSEMPLASVLVNIKLAITCSWAEGNSIQAAVLGRVSLLMPLKPSLVRFISIIRIEKQGTLSSTS